MSNEEQLKKLAILFRAALIRCERNKLLITLQDFPHGSCGDASYLLAKYLEEQGCGKFEYVLGKRIADLYSHAWLEQKGIIIDITADQFEGQNCSVLVTSDKSWHSQFVEEERQVADFELFNHSASSDLRRSYNQVKNKIET